MAELEEIANSDAVVTMVDVLKEQEDFEENANAVLGGSDDKNCTYEKGYVKRQALYACLTCCSDSKTDASKRAGLCLACSLTCHENHELVELYTKRNFRCDCGGPKFNSHPCQFTPLKGDLNNDNKYNQNFSGIYCICHRPYPDPEASTEEEMLQCIICEDWLHTGHLEAKVPTNDQYSEMICKQCMDSHCFLDDYIECSVNVDTELLDNSDLDIHNASGINNDITNDSNKSKINVINSEIDEMKLGNEKLVNKDINEQNVIMQNDNDQEEINKKSETQEIDKTEIEKKNDTSSNQLMDTVQVQVDEEKSGSKKDDPCYNNEANPGDEKDNTHDIEEDISGNNGKDDSDYANTKVEADIEIKELREGNQECDKIPCNNLGVISNKETFFEDENIDFKKPNQVEDIITSFDADHSNPHTECDSQRKPFGKTTNDSNIPTESESQNKEFGNTADDSNIDIESDSQNKEFVNTTDDSESNTEVDSQKNKFVQSTDDSIPKIHSDSQNKELEKNNQGHDEICTDTEINTNPEIEGTSQNKSFKDSNVVDIIPCGNFEIRSLNTAKNNSTAELGNSTPRETICEKVNSPVSAQTQEDYPGNEILQGLEQPLEVDTTETKYDSALTSLHAVDNGTGSPALDEKVHITSSQNDKFENIIPTITGQEKDTDSSNTPEKLQIEESNSSSSQHEDNGNTKKDINNSPSTSKNQVEEIHLTKQVFPIIPEQNENKNAQADNNDNSTKTEKIETKEIVSSEVMDTSNSANDLKITNDEGSNIDKLETTAVDTDKCDNINKDLVAPGKDEKQGDMDIDEKEDPASSVQEQDQYLLNVNEICPKIIEDSNCEEEFITKPSENIEINMLEKQVDVELSKPSERNSDNAISDDTETLTNDQIESEIKDGEDVVAVSTSASAQESTTIINENITDGHEHRESSENEILENNDIQMQVSETSDAKKVNEVTYDERMNVEVSETVDTKTSSTRENEGSNENDIAKLDKFEASNINNENIRQAISEDVDMTDVESTACDSRSENETVVHLDNKEKSGEKYTECKIKESTLEASPTCDSQSIKRKQDCENFTGGKKIKIEADVDVTDNSETIQCLRPRQPIHGHKGATFWPCNWRKKLCSCFNCVAMYRNNDVLFLIDLEDTVSAYEDLGKSTNANSQYAKGLEALSSLDRIQQINAITEYNKMKEKLLDFLKSFKDKREVVKEEDIKEFFAGMKPRREPDGVYFCR